MKMLKGKLLDFLKFGCGDYGYGYGGCGGDGDGYGYVGYGYVGYGVVGYESVIFAIANARNIKKSADLSSIL